MICETQGGGRVKERKRAKESEGGRGRGISPPKRGLYVVRARRVGAWLRRRSREITETREIRGRGRVGGEEQELATIVKDLFIGSRDNNSCVVDARVLAIGLQHHQAEDAGHHDRDDENRHRNTHQDWGAENFRLLLHPECVPWFASLSALLLRGVWVWVHTFLLRPLLAGLGGGRLWSVWVYGSCGIPTVPQESVRDLDNVVSDFILIDVRKLECSLSSRTSERRLGVRGQERDEHAVCGSEELKGLADQRVVGLERGSSVGGASNGRQLEDDDSGFITLQCCRCFDGAVLEVCCSHRDNVSAQVCEEGARDGREDQGFLCRVHCRLDVVEGRCSCITTVYTTIFSNVFNRKLILREDDCITPAKADMALKSSADWYGSTSTDTLCKGTFLVGPAKHRRVGSHSKCRENSQ